MTMPHLENCQHDEKGWCLACVKEQWLELDEARQQLAECQAELTRLRGVRADQPDPVKAPAHYTTGKIECWDAIRAMLGDEGFVSFCRGTVVKYLWRAPHKGAELEDYKKAKAYLEKLTSVKEQP